MVWTREIPTQPGWYWWRPAPKHTKCIVLLSGGLLYSVLEIMLAKEWSRDDWPAGGEWQQVAEPTDS